MSLPRPNNIHEILTMGQGADLEPSSNWTALSILIDTERDPRDIEIWDRGYCEEQRDHNLTSFRVQSLGNALTSIIAQEFADSHETELPRETVITIANRFADKIEPPLNKDGLDQFSTFVVDRIPIALDAIRARKEELGFLMAFWQRVDNDPDAALALWSTISKTKPLDLDGS